MSRQINITTTSFDKELSSHYIYKDKSGNFYIHQKHGIINWIGRVVTELLGVRTYQLHTLIADIATLPQSASRDTNLQALLGKMAKGCGISKKTYDDIALTEKILQKTVPSDQEKDFDLNVGAHYIRKLIVWTEVDRLTLISQLQKSGIYQINGQAIENVVVARRTLEPELIENYDDPNPYRQGESDDTAYI